MKSRPPIGGACLHHQQQGKTMTTPNYVETLDLAGVIRIAWRDISQNENLSGMNDDAVKITTFVGKDIMVHPKTHDLVVTPDTLVVTNKRVNDRHGDAASCATEQRTKIIPLRSIMQVSAYRPLNPKETEDAQVVCRRVNAARAHQDESQST